MHSTECFQGAELWEEVWEEVWEEMIQDMEDGE